MHFSIRYTAAMSVTAAQCWDAIFRLGADDLASNDIPDDIVAKLSEFNITSVAADGIPHLTPYGKSCFDVLISGQGSVPELTALAELEEQGG